MRPKSSTGVQLSAADAIGGMVKRATSSRGKVLPKIRKPPTSKGVKNVSKAAAKAKDKPRPKPTPRPKSEKNTNPGPNRKKSERVMTGYGATHMTDPDTGKVTKIPAEAKKALKKLGETRSSSSTKLN